MCEIQLQDHFSENQVLYIIITILYYSRPKQGLFSGEILRFARFSAKNCIKTELMGEKSPCKM